MDPSIKRSMFMLADLSRRIPCSSSFSFSFLLCSASISQMSRALESRLVYLRQERSFFSLLNMFYINIYYLTLYCDIYLYLLLIFCHRKQRKRTLVFYLVHAFFFHYFDRHGILESCKSHSGLFDSYTSNTRTFSRSFVETLSKDEYFSMYLLFNKTFT